MPTDPEPDPGDPFGPPAVNTEVGCLHCQEVYDSYRIEWRVMPGRDGRPQGFWCCPTPGCGGIGFGFDILPTDPEYADEDGNRMWVDDGDDEGDLGDWDTPADLGPPPPRPYDPDSDIPF